MQKTEFPKNFYWGSAFSAPQTEPNGNLKSSGTNTIWDFWYKNDKEKFFEGNFAINNFKENYQNDIKIAKQINMNSLRTSFSWSRILPDGKNVDKEAIDYYNKVLDEFDKNNLTPFINMFHFDMPMWAQEKGGWTSREVVDAFAYYGKVLFENFGNRVKYWFTFNEPIVSVEGQYLYGWHYPNHIDFNEAMLALWNTNVAHSLVVKEFRKSNAKGEIGIILNITPALPRSEDKLDLEAAKIAELFQWKSYLDTIVKGVFPEELINKLKEKNLWPNIKTEQDDKKLFIKNKIDILGVNYYAPLRVKALDHEPDWSKPVTPNTHFFDIYTMPDARMNIYRGWEIFPKALYSMLKVLKDEYGNIKHYVSENGMGVQDEERFMQNGVINDDYRIEFLKEHIYWMKKAMDEGANCIGYHTWAYIDNWSWTNAYKNRYGFISLDIKTGERTFKKSASWFKKLAIDNILEYDESIIN